MKLGARKMWRWSYFSLRQYAPKLQSQREKIINKLVCGPVRAFFGWPQLNRKCCRSPRFVCYAYVPIRPSTIAALTTPLIAKTKEDLERNATYLLLLYLCFAFFWAEYCPTWIHNYHNDWYTQYWNGYMRREGNMRIDSEIRGLLFGMW